MKSFKNLLFENQDGIGILTMNRPAALNSLNQETVNELAELFGEVGKDSTVKVLIITGAEKAFVAGAVAEAARRPVTAEKVACVVVPCAVDVVAG